MGLTKNVVCLRVGKVKDFSAKNLYVFNVTGVGGKDKDKNEVKEIKSEEEMMALRKQRRKERAKKLMVGNYSNILLNENIILKRILLFKIEIIFTDYHYHFSLPMYLNDYVISDFVNYLFFRIQTCEPGQFSW